MPDDDSPDQQNTKPSKKTSKIRAYADLGKARLSSLVVATTAAGFIAAGSPLCPATLSVTCLGTALCASSAAALNQIFEVDRDTNMKRTQQRPLVTGALTISQATSAAALWGAAGTSLLYVGTDPVTTTLGVSNIVLYAGVYTYLKPRSVYNTWVGAVVGAIPPVMGWTAATGGSLFEVEPLLLGGTLYLWQMPHFFALSYMHRVDYARGGFQMVPVLEEEANGDETSRIVVRYTWYLATLPVLSTLLDVTSSMFCLEGMVLNSYALYVAHKFRRERTNANARKVFLTSLWYLPSLLMLFLLHSKRWDEDTTQEQHDNVLYQTISSNIHKIRDKGRDLCLHESAAVQQSVNTSDDDKTDNNNNKAACPVSLGKDTSKRVAETTQAVVASAATPTKETES